ncbi:MAG: GGDEF domain-containing protein [Caenispirillum sp.]|nr:GGDEF domain-containing protein [Caenispirillum sp.]
MKLLRLTPVIRLALGLTSLVITLLLVFQITGLVPDELEMARKIRNRTSESLAVQAASLLQAGDLKALGRTFEEVRARDPDIRSIAIRQNDGRLLVAVGGHEAQWRAPSEGKSTLDHVQVPILANQRRWGSLEISFAPVLPETLAGWLTYPPVILLLAVGTFGFVVMFLYMKRALQYLDPTTAVPDRVRQAFDNLSAAIVILDREGRIMMTNRAFAALRPEAASSLVGKRINDQPWLCEAIGQGSGYPWDKAMRNNAPEGNVGFIIRPPDRPGEVIHLNMQATPITDPGGAVRGCLISIDNVTQMFQVNEQLLQTLIELDNTRKQIERQNEELHRLASRDPLTGCLNRRSFFDELDRLFAEARAQASVFSCIMTDIDHFKSFNDRYGHAVGDDVIRALVHTLQARLRSNDLLCRYGGEEFCIILPGVRLDQAIEIAERLRADVEERAGPSVRSSRGLAITASFGVAALGADITDPAEIISRADDALYRSKEAGRNRVTAWRE